MIRSLFLLAMVLGSLSAAATTFTGTGVSADLTVGPQHTLSVTITGTFVATIILEQKVSGGYVPQQTWNSTITYKPPTTPGVFRLRCSAYTSGTATYVLASVADNQVIYRKPDGTTAFSVDVDGLVTSAGGAVSGGSITGATIDNSAIGGTTPAAGAFTTIAATGPITSTQATGTAPFVVASTTNVANLNASSLGGATFAAPGAIGGTTPAAATFTTVTATDTTASSITTPGGVTSTVVTGTAPFTAASTTACPNLNASLLLGSTWVAPGAIGGTTPSTGAFTTLSATSTTSFSGATTFTSFPVKVGNGTGAPVLSVDGAAGSGRTVALRTNGGNRWLMLADSGAESGANAGSSFALRAYDDSAVQIGSDIINITRAASGTLTLSRPTLVSDATEASAVGTASLVASGGLGIAKRSFLGTIGSTFKGDVLAGVQDGTAAVAGQVGEVLSGAQSTYTNYTSTATYQQVTTIALTAGDWDVHATLTVSDNSATMTANANAIVALGTTTASAAGTTEGQTIIYIPQNGVVLSTGKQTVSINVPISVAATTNYFLNSQATFTGGNPQFVGYLYARRIR